MSPTSEASDIMRATSGSAFTHLAAVGGTKRADVELVEALADQRVEVGRVGLRLDDHLLQLAVDRLELVAHLAERVAGQIEVVHAQLEVALEQAQVGRVAACRGSASSSRFTER